MSKNLELKQQVVAEIKEKFQKATSVVIVDYRGINVEQVTELRKQYRAANVEYAVLKNTLVKRALSELGIEGLDQYLEGPNAFAFAYGDSVSSAKVLCDFINKSKCENLDIRAGLVDGQIIDTAGVKALAALPPKEVLIARLLGSFKSPMSSFARVIKEIAKKNGGEAPAEEAAPAEE